MLEAIISLSLACFQPPHKKRSWLCWDDSTLSLACFEHEELLYTIDEYARRKTLSLACFELVVGINSYTNARLAGTLSLACFEPSFASFLNTLSSLSLACFEPAFHFRSQR